MRKFILLTVTLLVAACASLPLDAPKLDAPSFSTLAIDQSEVLSSDGALFGITSSGSRVADLKPCYVIVTRQAITLVTWNHGPNRAFKKELSLPFSQIKSAALVHYGNMGHLRQIHVRSELGKVVISYGLGESPKAENVFALLTNAGVQVTGEDGYVRGATDGNGAIPIFIPAR